MYKVRRQADKEIYALKKVRLDRLSPKEKLNALNEVRILASIKHPNVVGFKEAFIDVPSNSLCLVMDYANDGDLLQKIKNFRKERGFFSENEIWSILIQLL